MSSISEGYANAAARGFTGPSYMPSADPGTIGGGTLTGQSDVEPTLAAYENIFGPGARDIKLDLQRFKRHGRWHLPDILKGPNQYLTDRVDGLITDATNSPFTSRILPYKYITNVDGKIKWNVWSFDEGFASRVPYEAAARTLQQSKRSYSGYAVRHGLAMVLEHNFMMTPQGRENFKNQLNQMIGSIQMTNDLDVHVALIQAPSYERVMRERYVSDDKTPLQVCREYVDMFGFMQKNTNALDILIEESKAILRTWGSPMPDFMLCNSKLTFNLQMSPDRTNFVTQGAEGPKRLKAGPDLSSYRGLSIIPSRSFSMEVGAHPRDILRRRVRVAEYSRIPATPDAIKYSYQFYHEGQDAFSTLTFKELLTRSGFDGDSGRDSTDFYQNHLHAEIDKVARRFKKADGSPLDTNNADRLDPKLYDHVEFLVIRPNIEHYMFGIILGLGGESLGSTFWGQTELSCYDDSQHGIWGMSYKYHERAIVINERNLIRLWDVGYDGYVGGKGDEPVQWDSDKSLEAFKISTQDVTRPYQGASMMVLAFLHDPASPPLSNWPSPLRFYEPGDSYTHGHTNLSRDHSLAIDSDNIRVVNTEQFSILHEPAYRHFYDLYRPLMPDFTMLHKVRKNAGQATVENESVVDSIAFQGTMRVLKDGSLGAVREVQGSGHHGPDFVGCASLRSGKGYKLNTQPTMQRLV